MGACSARGLPCSSRQDWGRFVNQQAVSSTGGDGILDLSAAAALRSLPF